MGSTILCVGELLDNSYPVEEGLKIIYKLRPEWARDDIKSKIYSFGFINAMVCYFIGDGDENEADDVILVRIYGKGASLLFSGNNVRDTEFYSVQVGAASGSFPPVLAVFQNGFAYQRASGRTITWRDYTDKHILRALGRCLAQLHYTDPCRVSLVDRGGQPYQWDKATMHLHHFLRAQVNVMPHKLSDPDRDHVYQTFAMSTAALAGEIEWVIAYLDELDTHRCVSTHDVHRLNLIYNENTASMCVVDFDYGMNGYPGIDLTYSYIVFLSRHTLGWASKDDPEVIDTPELRRHLFTSYLERKHELQGQGHTDITEDEIKLMDIEFDIFLTMAYFRGGVFTLCLSDDPIVNNVYDILRFTKLCFEKYFAGKDMLVELKSRHQEIKKHLDDPI